MEKSAEWKKKSSKTIDHRRSGRWNHLAGETGNH